MPSSSRPPDQRRFHRFKADVPAIARLVGEREIISLRTLCESISEGGVGARGRGLEALALGDDVVSLELYLPISTLQPIWVDAVVRCITDRCGLEFLSLSDEQRKIIKHYCRLHPREKRRRERS